MQEMTTSFPKMEFERRVAPRVVQVLRVVMDGTVEVHALDVSATGVRLVSPRPLSENVSLDLELEADLGVHLTGIPVWQQALNRAGQCMVGLHFVESDERLASWISAQQDAA